MNEDLRDRIALFRYGVISDLVSRVPAAGEKEHVFSEICEKEWEIPGTRRRRIGRSTARNWLEQYQAHGFEGLKPMRRKDAGQSRGIPDEIQDLLLALRKERPKAPIRRLMDLVNEAGPADAPRLSASTVYRFFAQHPPDSDDSAGEERSDARAFVHEHINDLWMSVLLRQRLGVSHPSPGAGVRDAERHADP